MNRAEIEAELNAMLRSLEAPYAAARDATPPDTEKMAQLEAVATEIDLLLDQLALIGLAELAGRVTKIRSKIDGFQRDIEDIVAGPLSGIEALIRKIFAQTEEEEISAPSVVVPTIDVPVAAVAAPPPATEGQLILTDAHLVALWRRSLFPIDDSKVIVFGLRGCRPVDFSGTGISDGHEIAMSPVDYATMRCTIGHWKPGKGLAIFPGSTVPYGPIVASRIAKNGVGVNQLGRGRYNRYVAGWHKRSEGSNGHWALLQECPISLQRTGDDQDYDRDDRWEVGRIAGDNIHCAFHMGVDGNPADAKYSSAGCQVIAGTVVKGQRNSEMGPYKAFIEPFINRLGSQKETQYVLFAAEEAEMMIRTRCAGKTVLLRFGSHGPLVEQLQRALNRKANASLQIDGDFGPATFLAVTDFQTRNFDAAADDGVVGAATAKWLGLELPQFDFDDAIAGGPGFRTAAGHGEQPGPGTDPEEGASPPTTPVSSAEVRANTGRIDTGYQPEPGWTVAKQNDKWYLRRTGKSELYLGYEFQFGSYRGLARTGVVEDSLHFDYKDHEAEHGLWSAFLQPTAMCESETNFYVVNAWDSAAMTLGFFQMAAHTGEHLADLFRHLLDALPGQANTYFPELKLGHQIGLRGDQARRIYAVNGGDKLDLDETVAHPDGLARRNYDRGRFMAFFNPHRARVDVEEAVTAARWIAWIESSPEARGVIVANAVSLCKRAVADLHELVLAANLSNLPNGLDGAPMSVVQAAVDVKHHGRRNRDQNMSTHDTILHSLSKTRPLQSFRFVDTGWREERSKRNVLEISKMAPVYDGKTLDVATMNFQ
ncbi:MAG: peptidoglycan-binding domain-containing protein [Erythrobacter sp.]|jgi:hypothetical protein|nr:peptidoglycan-binding domain-containing protein [Erythrobacter sp.]